MGMRVRSGVNYTLLNEEQTAAIKDQPNQLKNILVLGDTGATHSLIPLNVANQLGLEIDPNRRGSIILGDGHSGVPIRGQCIVPITIGKYSCEVPALIMDVDWGSSQHLVLGTDWITQHHAMLGAGTSKGPQLDIRGRSGREKHTIFAKKVGRPKENQPPGTLESIITSAPRFAAMLEQLQDLTGQGSPWDAVDLRVEGGEYVIQFHGEEPMPLRTFLEEDDWFSFSCMTSKFQQTTVSPPPPPTPPPPPVDTAHTKYHNQDLSKMTPTGISAETLEGWRAKFPTVFQEDLPDRSMEANITPRPETIHSIPLLPNAKPVYRRQRRLSPAEREEISKQLKYHIAKGLVQPSSSPWGAPILFTPKPDGTLRMCIDYRGLNAVTERDVYPLPRAEDLYAMVKGKRVFSSLDLLKGYWQIGIQPRDSVTI